MSLMKAKTLSFIDYSIAEQILKKMQLKVN